jgi:hypothetical protein
VPETGRRVPVAGFPPDRNDSRHNIWAPALGKSRHIEAALEGLEIRRAKLDEQIRAVREMMGSQDGRRGPGRPRKNAAESEPAEAPARNKRRLTAAGRKRLAELMRQEWAAKRTVAQAKAAEKR